MTTIELGPVSATLEAELRNKVRQSGILLWLDPQDNFTGIADRLTALRSAGSLPYEVHAFRGSFLELMLETEQLEGGVEMTPLLIHLPGLNEESVRETPLLELYFAGKRYQKAIKTLVNDAAGGRVRTEQIAAFRDGGAFTLEEADAWLAELLADRDGGLASHLRALSLPAVFDDLLGGGFVASRIVAAEDRSVLWERFAAWTGLPATWSEEVLPPGAPRAEDVAFAAAGWALAVEYVDDLKRPPVAARLQAARGLPRPVVDSCRALAAHLRERHKAFYRRTADETEAILRDEVEIARAEDLGKIDTFRFEEDKVLGGAIEALGRSDWQSASDWASARDAGASFWLRDDPSRRSAWLLVADASLLGIAIEVAGSSLDARGDMERAVDRYTAVGSRVDRAHRHLEQRRAALLYPPLPEFESLRATLDRVRSLWRDWADLWSVDFNELCKARGFLPNTLLQQRAIFDEVVKPLALESGTTALFVVDAFRFEMGEELYATLADTPATTVQLRPRLAELPSVTEVGMNVLAPVADRGKLRPAISEGKVLGFSTGEFRVSDPESRKRAMHDRVGGPTCPLLTLEDVVTRESTSLKQSIARARLVVVHSDEIDRAGERGVGPAVFDQVMQKLRAAWRLLRDAGVRRFVLTADHGFLLIDEGARGAQPHGRKVDPKRRHVFSAVAADHPGEVRVPLAELGYDSSEQLMFPESTAVFDTGRRPTGFVHGGNSLQERVIPVLTLVHRTAVGGSNTHYVVLATAKEGVGGMHCVEIKVLAPPQGELGFGGVPELELALRVPELPEVRAEPCQTRGGAKIAAGSIVATVGEPFELFFRLTGPADARVLVEIHHQGAEAEVAPCVVDGRFAVTAPRGTQELAPRATTVETNPGWLSILPEGGVRQLFEHLAVHGAVTEVEASTMLGGPRELRRFANRFEEYAAKAPFGVRIDVIGGVKRYVREGTTT
jgi:hypothetical protein